MPKDTMTTDPESESRRTNADLPVPTSSPHINDHRTRDFSRRNVSRDVAFPNSSRRQATAAAVARQQAHMSPTPNTGSCGRSEHQFHSGTSSGEDGSGCETEHKQLNRRSSKGHHEDSEREDSVRTAATSSKKKSSRHRRKKKQLPPNPPPAFVPENPSYSILQRMFMDEKSADVVFQVTEKGRKKSERQKTITFPTKFYAHRCILQQCAPQLAKLCGSVEGGKTSVPITDVRPEVFRLLLSYLYGLDVSETAMRANDKGLIDAAHKYRISILKLEAEACFVKSRMINMENMMKHLLYADAKNCALLKEAVMDFIVENKVEVLESVALKDAPEGLLADVLAATARGEKKNVRGTSRESNQLSTLRISDLRRKSHEKGLDIDESRETLIAALKENCSESFSSASS